jgi:DNA-binding Lrp family transcriptional regulator
VITTGNQRYQRNLNTAHVMRLIRSDAPISRTEISSKLGLTRSTVSSIVSELREGGLVEETGLQASTERGGRRATAIDFRAGLPPILGVELRPDRYSAALIDFHGRVKDTSEGMLPPPERLTPRWVVSAIGEISSTVRQRIFGVGIGVSATVNPVGGTVLTSNIFSTSDCDVARPVSRALGLSVLVENDANCVAWGERDRESAGDRARGTVVCVHLAREVARGGVRGFGVGLGIVVDGAVHYGRDFSAGEIHSSQWRRGNALQIAADPSEYRDEATFERAAVTEILVDLGVIASALRPDRIHYSGDLLAMSDLIEVLLRTDLSSHYIAPRVSGCPIEPAIHGSHAVAIGAASMFAQQLFSVPGAVTPRPDGLPSWREIVGNRPGGAE